LIRQLYRLRWIEISNIPDDELLWRSVYKKDQIYKNGRPKPAFFRDKSGLSCDLAKFSTPERSRRGFADPPWPAEAGLVEFSRRDVRDAKSDVKHKPIATPRNYAHCQLDVPLDKKGEQHMADAARWRIEQRLKKVLAA